MDRIISEIKNTADKVAKKSSELLELSKVKLGISNTKASIDNNFKILGELVYHSQKNDGEIDTDKLEETISTIDELYKKLGEYNNLEAELTNKKLCPKCQKLNENDAAFCSRCAFDFSDN